MDITEVPMLTAARIEKRKERRRAAARKGALVFCTLLVLISLSAHILGAVVLYGFITGEEIKTMLICSVLPDYICAEALSEKEPTEVLPPETTSVPPETEAVSAESEEIPLQLPPFLLKNETSYHPDLEVLYNSPNPILKADRLYEKYTEDVPLVLIYHTHATESYSDTGTDGSYRSDDPEKNMIAVGRVIASALEANGIKTIHLTEMFDLKSYNDSYYNSASAVEQLTEEYPSIQYIIDVHRDSVVDSNGNYLSADFRYGELSAAQMMFVVGTDEGGSEHVNWRSNLTAVLHLEEKLLRDAPDSMRPINLRIASFYQHRSPGAMLLEIGTCENTLLEAKRSAVIFACALSEYVLGKKIPITADVLLESVG